MEVREVTPASQLLRPKVRFIFLSLCARQELVLWPDSDAKGLETGQTQHPRKRSDLPEKNKPYLPQITSAFVRIKEFFRELEEAKSKLFLELWVNRS